MSDTTPIEEQGEKMTPIERKPSPKSGLRAFLRAPGSGVLSTFVLLCASVALLAAAASASAAQDHAYSTSFGEPGSGAGHLSLTPFVHGEERSSGSGVAVNDETGDIYVADTGNHRVDQFGPNGTFLRAWGWEVNAEHPEAKLQTCTAASGCQAGLSGTKAGQFENPVFIAVDNSCSLHRPVPLHGSECEAFDPSSGDVYVADNVDSLFTSVALISKFDSGGNLVETWGNNGEGPTKNGPPNGQLNGLNAISTVGPYKTTEGPFRAPFFGATVDPSGNLWVESAGEEVFEFDSAGASIRSWYAETGNGRAGLAVDSSGFVYRAGGSGEIEKRGPTGARIGAIYRSPINSISGFSLDAATGDLYVGEAGTSILDISGRCEPSGFGCAPVQTFGGGHLEEAAGLAVGPDDEVYAANSAVDQVAVFTVALEATATAPTEVAATAGTLNGEIDPKGGEVTKCFLQFGETTVYGHNHACLNASGEEVGTPAHPITSPTAVHAKVEGLHGGSRYHFRVFAVNTGSESIHSEDEILETRILPVLSAEEATEVTSTSARLAAKVNPKGLAVTECRFEWGTSTAYSATAPCEPSRPGSGASPVSVATHLSNLSPNVEYHWRLVAADANGIQKSPDNTFVFLTESPGSPSGSCAGNESLRLANGSTALPDCRAYEQVTPARKNGATVGRLFLGPKTEIAGDGSRLLAPSLQCFSGSGSCIGDRQEEGAPFELSRTATGWITRPAAPPASRFSGNSQLQYHPNTGTVLFGIPTTGLEQYYAGRPDGSFEAIGPTVPQPGSKHFAEVFASTADLSHIVFDENGGGSWPFDPGSGLYEYVGTGNAEPFLVAVEGPKGSTSLVANCPAELGTDRSAANSFALSADGRTVYFTSSCTGKLYARIDGELSDARTVMISERSPTDCTGACAASLSERSTFQGASTDGSAAYFTSGQQLTNGAIQGSVNLYRYEDPQEVPLSGNHLIDVSAGDTSGIGPEVQGVMAISPDGSHVYFVAKGTLTGANAEGKEPTEGAPNLYLYQRDPAHPGGETSFVATLDSENEGNGGDGQQWVGGIGHANVTPEGRFLVFSSQAALTPDATHPGGPAQIYRYDAQAEELTRVSIGRRGFNDNGNAGSGGASIVRAFESFDEKGTSPSVSSDGSRVFFQSPIGLTPGALNDVATNSRGSLAQNVYEWEADGTGSCAEAGGCVYLISDGHDASEGPGGTESGVELLGTDASGEDVFFATNDQLTPSDTDSGLDYYDARVGGGFAAPPTPTPCQADACKGPGTEAGPAQSPGSASFNGAEEGPKHPKKPAKVRKQKRHKKAHKKHQRAASQNRGGNK
jgi:NHL repeat